MQTLARLGEQLGQLQDLCNLEAQLQTLAPDQESEALAERLEKRKGHCKRRIIRLFIKVYGRRHLDV